MVAVVVTEAANENGASDRRYSPHRRMTVLPHCRHHRYHLCLRGQTMFRSLLRFR